MLTDLFSSIVLVIITNTLYNDWFVALSFILFLFETKLQILQRTDEESSPRNVVLDKKKNDG